MDITLNNYIKRANEIEILDKKEKNEINLMIHYLEKTLLYIKLKYENTINTDKYEKNINIATSSHVIKNCSYTSLYINSPNIINLYYIDELKQYSIKINNLILRGNLGNIYDKKILQNDNIKAHQVMCCQYRNKCNNILNEQYCKYFHDPLDLFLLKNSKTISEKFYLECIKYVRNFSNTSWLYTPDKPMSKNVRLIGSKSTLANDTKLVKISQNYKDSIENMKMQVMHDLLVLLSLTESNIV